MRADRRAASEVLGILLAFSLVVSLVAIVQVNAVPVWNGDLEYTHSQESHASMVELDEAVTRATTSGLPERVTFDRGVEYPTRLVFLNPPPAMGSLTTSEASTVTLSNVEAVGSPSTYWDGTKHTFETQAVSLHTDYRELATDQTIHYEGGVLFTDRDDTEVVSQQTLVNGNHVSLVAVEGELGGTSTESVTVDVVPASVGGDALVVRNDVSTGNAITLTLPTTLSETSWEEQLDGTYGAVDSYDASQGTVTVRLATQSEGGPGVYKLHLSKVVLGTATTTPPAAYLVPVSGDGEHVPEDGSHLFTVETRDGYNNPVAGATVRASTSGTGMVTAKGLATADTTTDDDGRALFVYEAPDSVSGPSTKTITVDVLNDSGTVVDTIDLTVEVRKQ